MANHTAVLMSYDPSLINEYKIKEMAFIIACLIQSTEIYDNLKFLLDNTHEIKVYADRG